MTHHRSEVISPPAFYEMDDAFHVSMLRDRLPQRWKLGARDSVESIGEMLGETRDYHLYRKVGAQDWADYCATFLASPPAAMDELIEGVRILRGRDPNRTNIHADEACDEGRKAREEKVAKARRDAATIKSGTRTDLEPPAGGRRLAEGSNNTEHLLRRIARQAETDPAAREVLAAYEAGSFSSVAEAARAAGIKKPSKPEPPEKVAKRILAQGNEHARAVMDAIAAELETHTPMAGGAGAHRAGGDAQGDASALKGARLDLVAAVERGEA